MPKNKKLTVYVTECVSFDCPDEYYFIGKVPDKCPKGHQILSLCTRKETMSQITADEIDAIKSNESPRPAWYPKRQEEIRQRSQSIGGTITCGICNKEVDVNEKGKEEWTSKGGNPHETVPHTDHCWSPGRTTGGPWVHRKRELLKQPAYQAAPPIAQKEMKKQVFNASPLRVAHMFCNCSEGSYGC